MSLGFHVCKGETFAKSLADTIGTVRKEYSMNIQSAQIFVVNPRSAKDLITDDDAKMIKKLTDDGLRLIAHGCYIAHPFGEKSAQSIHIIRRELAQCNKIGAEGFVVHLPRRSADRIEEIYPQLYAARGSTKIYLEIESMKASEHTYETPAKLEVLFKKLMKIDPDVGLCIDSAHLWSSGVDNREYSAVKEWTSAVDAIGIRHKMFHLNDSNRLRGSGQDNHHRLTHGNIWREFNMDTGKRDIRESGLSAYLEWIVRENMPVILERDEEGLEMDFSVLKRMGYFSIEDK